MTLYEQRIGPEEVRSYLHSQGWVSVAQSPLAQIWKDGARGEWEVLVPLHTQAADFDKRLRILISDLVHAEQRDQNSIESDIASIFLDVTNLRAAHSSLIDDSIPLQAGYELFGSAQKFVVASAAATIRRQGYFRNMPLRAREHAKNVRLGHTKRGSYIVPILSQARAPELVYEANQEHIDIAVEETLFDRRVTATMSRALDTLSALVSGSRTPNSSDINDAVGEGVSRELCRAVEAVIKSDAVDELDISFNWSKVSSAPAGSATSVKFERGSEGIVGMVSEYLLSAPQAAEHVIYGVITELKRRPGDATGRVGIETLLGGRRKIVWMDLVDDAYHLAVRCHDRGVPVSARGVLNNAPGKIAVMDVIDFGPDASLFSAGAMDVDSIPGQS
ncbi:hypothetical protein G6W47_07640 [Streptomyces sp. CAI-21]|uniref:hypothetical protein n=1 Tax=Streptomyces sp. CAI-21 TaxID=1169743 RepID=UPI00158703E8|nr:hypothetical protein [Streptomyces sp. CAI-21]